MHQGESQHKRMHKRQIMQKPITISAGFSLWCRKLDVEFALWQRHTSFLFNFNRCHLTASGFQVALLLLLLLLVYSLLHVKKCVSSPELLLFYEILFGFTYASHVNIRDYRKNRISTKMASIRQFLLFPSPKIEFIFKQMKLSIYCLSKWVLCTLFDFNVICGSKSEPFSIDASLENLIVSNFLGDVSMSRG